MAAIAADRRRSASYETALADARPTRTAPPRPAHAAH